MRLNHIVHLIRVFNREYFVFKVVFHGYLLKNRELVLI